MRIQVTTSFLSLPHTRNGLEWVHPKVPIGPPPCPILRVPSQLPKRTTSSGKPTKSPSRCQSLQPALKAPIPAPGGEFGLVCCEPGHGPGSFPGHPKASRGSGVFAGTPSRSSLPSLAPGPARVGGFSPHAVCGVPAGGAGRWQPGQAARAASRRCLMGFQSSGIHRELLSRKRRSARAPARR